MSCVFELGLDVIMPNHKYINILIILWLIFFYSFIIIFSKCARPDMNDYFE